MPITSLQRFSEQVSPVEAGGLQALSRVRADRPEPGLFDVFLASARENVIVSPFADQSVERSIDHSFNPYRDAIDIVESVPDQFRDAFMDARTPLAALQIADNIRHRVEAQQTLARAGLAGFGASVLATISSPEVLLPGSLALKIPRLGSVATRTASFAGGGVLSATAAEIPLSSFDPTRTLAESAINITGSGALGGLFGFVGGTLIENAARGATAAERRMGQLLDQAAERVDVTEWAKAKPAERFEKLQDIIRDLDPTWAKKHLTQNRVKRFAKRWATGWTLSGRLASSESPTAQLIARNFLDTPFIKDGPAPVESMKLLGMAEMELANAQLAKTWREYLQAGGDKLAALRNRAGFENSVDRAFYEDVTLAMGNGDTALEEVVDAGYRAAVEHGAKQLRQWTDTITDGVLERGFASEFRLEGDRSWMHRIWNRFEVESDPEGFLNDIAPLMPKRELLTRRELAQRMYDKITGATDGHVNLKHVISAPDVVQARSFEIPTAMIPRRWLELDARNVVRDVARVAIPDIEFARRAGTYAGDMLDDIFRHTKQVIKSGSSEDLELLNQRIFDIDAAARLDAKLTQEATDNARDLEDLIIERERLTRAGGSASEELADLSKQIEELRAQAGVKAAGPEKLRLGTEEDIVASVDRLKDAAEGVRREEALRAVNLAPHIERVNREFTELIAEANRKRERTSHLVRRKRDTIQGLKDMRDMLRGTFGRDTNDFADKAVDTLLKANNMRLMGGVTIASVGSDLVNSVFVAGLGSYARAFKALVFSPEFRATLKRLDGDSVGKLASAFELGQAGRAAQLADVIHDGSRGTGVERVMQWGQDGFFRLTLINRWNATLKKATAYMVQDRMLRAAQRVTEGTATKADMRRFARAGINEQMAKDAWAEFREHGVKPKAGRPLMLANSGDWSGDVRRLWQASVLSDINRTIVTPSVGDFPVWMQKGPFRLMSQFRRFGVAAVNKMLIPALQDADRNTLAWLVLAPLAGMATTVLKDFARDREIKERTIREWILDGVDRSGMLGSLMDVNGGFERLGGFGLSQMIGGSGVTRFQHRNLASVALGPTAGMFENMHEVLKAARSGEATQATVRAVRKNLVGQSLFYAAWLFDVAEDAAAEGLPERRSR